MKEKIAVIIPALNEELTIAKVVRDFKKELPNARVIVYDNNSTDKTAELAKKAGAEVRTVLRRGKGRVMQNSFEDIKADIFVIVDADDTYPAGEVHKLIEPVINREADMTVGSRMGHFKKEKKRLAHRIGNKIILWALKFCFPAEINDMLSGYRVLSKELVRELNLVSTGFAIETEMTVKTLEAGYKIKEIPVEYRPRPKGSESKLDSFSDGIYIMTTVLELFRDYRPMQFFIALSIIPFMLSAGFAYSVFADYARYNTLIHVTNLIFAGFFILITLILWSMGFIASSVHKSNREIMHMLKKIKHKGSK